jgi:hypothetical protein
MNRFKVNETNNKDECTEIYDYIKNKPILKITITLYKGPEFVKSETTNHTFEIYEEIKVNVKKNEGIKILLKEITTKIDLLFPNENI